MKIAIVTLVGDFNYGNRLQNYALQEILTSFGAEVSTIDNPPQSTVCRIKERFIERIDGKKQLKSICDLCREKKLRDFTKQYIHMCDDDFIKNDFDYFVVGSDQVWNPSFWGNDIECYSAKRYLLKNVDAIKRVAYAASFGVDQLNDFWRPIFQKELPKFHAISVREVSGAKIIENVCGKFPEVVLDPTLLLPKEKWNQIAIDVQESSYVLKFFLGEVSQQKQQYIEKNTHKYGYKIIDVNNKKDPYYSCSPQELLGLIKKAKLVYTDSFHVTVFSIIFHTPFIAMDREQYNYCKMSSRLDTLLSMVNMEERFNNIGMQDPYTCAFDNVDSLLKEKRKGSVHFLRNALGLCKNLVN